MGGAKHRGFPFGTNPGTCSLHGHPVLGCLSTRLAPAPEDRFSSAAEAECVGAARHIVGDLCFGLLAQT